MSSTVFLRPGDIGRGLERKKSLSTRMHLDLPLLSMLALLIGFGLMVLYSATDGNAREMQRQISFIALAFVAMIAVAQVEMRMLQRWAPWMFLGGIALLVGVLLFGVRANGAQRWLAIPGLPRFQPSEVMKIGVPLMVAWYLAKTSLPPRLLHVAISLMIIAVPVVLIARQPDLGTALLIGVSGIFVLLLAGISWKMVFSAGTLAVCSLPALWIFYLQDYQKARIRTFFDPESDPLGAGWNIIQSKTAIGSGGWYGKGWLNGVQSRLDFLPEGQTDFIVAVLGEEFGFMGMLLLLALYLAIIGRGLYIGAMAPDAFSRLLAGSITLTFFVYVFVNIGMVSGLLPVVGVPLPLVSLGGTSILTLMIGFGILMSIHTHARRSLLD